MTNPEVLHGRDIICLSSIDWDFIWQGHQEIMSTLAANGNRVLFVENTGVRRPSFKDLPRVTQRLRNWWRGTKGFRRDHQNLFIYSPLLLPFPYSRLAQRINRGLLTGALRRWMGAAGFGRPIVWTFLPTPLVRETIPRLDPLVSVYYCIDDFASSSPAAKRIAASERQLFRDADLVFVTSERLRSRAAEDSNSVHLFPFGVSYRKFEAERARADGVPADLASLPRPVVGYIGGIHRWVDFDLLHGVASAMPEATFAMVGPLQVDESLAPHLPNVQYLGQRAHEDVPRYIKGFDAAIVPYRLSEYTANVYPTKLNEYLAMGVPVVATDLPEIRRFNAEHGQHVAVASDAPGFTTALRTALAQSPAPEGRQQRIAVARENSWESRIARMSGLIEAAIDAKRSQPEPWEVRLRRAYRRARGRIVTAVVAVGVAYLLLFESPLLWIAARPLRMSEPPRPADAVVVLAGGVGESGEAGGGYQERVKTAIDLYDAGFTSHLVFVSGYAFAFKEAEIMRDLAVSRGVPESAIVLETTAATTYEDVVKARVILHRQGWRRILLVSSPYHMRRAMGVWAKQAPAIDVIPTPVTNSQFYTHGRGASFEQVRGIVHEYAALVYYRERGWL